jgi:tryptophan halogenase
MSQQKDKTHIVIVGGGTAGWVNLAYLAAKTDARLTIIHSDAIGIIGVGESTSPTVMQVAKAVGVDERIWMKDARATYKYGIDFHDWKDHGSYWFHSFDAELPEQCFHKTLTDNGKHVFRQNHTSVDYFLSLRQHSNDWDIDTFNDYHGPQKMMLETQRGHYDPRGDINIGSYPGYAYHINAFAYGQCLRRHTSAERFTEIRQRIVDVEINDNGIKQLVLEDGSTVSGDVYIDCTGFSRLLIGKFTEWEPFKGLPNNRAIFGSVPGYQSYRSTTQAHAQEVGWIWGIPTWGQMGSGYVYCSDFITDDQAHDTITKFWADRGYRWQENNRVKFVGGSNKKLAIKNVVSNGLAQSFIEPLEATSIMITCWSVIKFADLYNRHQGQWSENCARAFDTVMNTFLQRSKEYVRYHYRLSNRRDSEYWRHVTHENEQAEQEVSDVIQSLLPGLWPQEGETLINKWNWTSMLIGFDKQYKNPLPKFERWQLDNYIEYCRTLQQHYKFVTRNNADNKVILEQIHLDKG